MVLFCFYFLYEIFYFKIVVLCCLERVFMNVFFSYIKNSGILQSRNALLKGSRDKWIGVLVAHKRNFCKFVDKSFRHVRNQHKMA